MANPREGDYGTEAITASNYYKFEAEFKDASRVNENNTSLDSNDDGVSSKFWYGTAGEVGQDGTALRVGEKTPEQGLSNDYVWKCSQGVDSTGYAFTDIVSRWKHRHRGTGAEQVFRMGDEFRIFNRFAYNPAEDDTTQLPGYSTSDDSMYIRFHIKLNFSSELDTTDYLFKIETVGYPNDPIAQLGDISCPILHNTDDGRETSETIVTYGDYLAMQIPNESYFDFEIRVKYSDLIGVDPNNTIHLMTNYFAGIQSGIPKDKNIWIFLLKNLCPRLYWYGNCDLSLDYIEIEDQMHHDMLADETLFSQSIRDRVTDIVNLSHPNQVKHVYTFDEPYQGQFDSFRRVSLMLNNNNAKPITPVYYKNFLERKMPYGTDLFYNHQKAFKEVASPNMIMPDEYPVKDWITDWNAVSDTYGGLQWNIDQRLLNAYREAKEYSLQNPANLKPFYAVVQSFGRWDEASNMWGSWICPPPETQKMLQYLPLCFGADGIFDFMLQGYRGSNTVYDYCSLHFEGSNIIKDLCT